MSIVSNIIYAITDIHCCVSSNINSCCATLCPNRNVFDTMLEFNGVAGLPSYLQRSCYTPKHLGKYSSKPMKLKMQIFLRLIINAHKKQSFFVFQGLHCL